MLESSVFVRRTFSIKANQITEENAREIAKWCGGTVSRTLDDYEALYILIPVKIAGRPQEIKAWVGDWVTCSSAGKGFKVYPDKSFRVAFESPAINMETFAKVHQLVLSAMSRQDVCTYNEASSEATPYAEEVAKLILRVVR